ncbi:homeobox-leucine zipper protein ROC3 [Phoenix dactylifera]|uniref:Homeobox-leucine zipper protein ROC3 n=1 Tax=Phoenix dactylifera TaxID=42345 RepID=A0A8B8ZK76_PHODC|nr:homeobox-leucine zipper protein ROC3 [Phoenix dactylifera]XP_038974610.1 homeobox-leucine zipper protein ROC3 [Phoenix dactylifera]
MYGDCQVLSSMVGGGGGANAVSPDSLFSSPIQNPSFSFMSNMPFHSFPAIVPKEEGAMVMGRGGGKEEEMESGSGSGHVDGISCGEEQDNEQQQQLQPPAKKKRYHRHTSRQIQTMEALFKECPHPDDKQRLKLSQELGLKPRQVKFWFQNRRTQMKAHQDRQDNVLLRAENESLKNENFRLQAAIRNVVCPNCGGPAILGEMSFDEQHLRIENARLKDELERLSCITSRYGSRPVQPLGPAPLLLPSLDLDMGIYSRHFNEPPIVSCCDMIPVPPISDGHQPFSGTLIMDQDKPSALDLTMTAADQLLRMCHTNEPLWVRNGSIAKEVLDLEEYTRTFHWPMDLKQHQNGHFRTEATRDSALVIMNSITLVDAFLDANKWMELFPSIVSKARTVQIITAGISGHGNGSLHLMQAELHFPSPLVASREAYFFRYCHQNSEEGTWVIVDFPVDGFHDSLDVPFPRYRRRPSGCVIQDMPNGYSKVIWVEHAEVEDKPLHRIFDQFVSSGMAFGATRWVSILQRQCERLASLMARNISDLGVIPSPEARKNMMKLSQRMIRTLCANISTTGVQSWTALSDSSDDTIRVTTRKNTEPGQPNGVILTAVSTTWLPFSHQQVFDLLTDERRRSQLDVLSNGNSYHEVAHIANGSHPRNCVSLLRINAASNSSQNVELLLQESSTHPSGGSLVVYATIDVDAVQVAMSGEDPSFIPLLPTGFVISPPSPPATGVTNAPPPTTEVGATGDGSAIGCLLTVGMQVLASAVPSAKLNLSSVTAINNHLGNAVHQITAALGAGAKVDTVIASLEQ